MVTNSSLTVAAAQYPVSYFSTLNDWKAHIRSWVQDAVQQQATIVLFPEYGSLELVSVFAPEIQQNLAQQLVSLQSILPDFVSTFSELALEFNCVIVAPSFPVLELGRYLNRTYVFSKNGLVGHQDKWFMTRFEQEEWNISSGKKDLKVFEFNGGSFGIQTCYDVEFGIGSFHLCQAGVQLILSPSCTETVRGATRVHIGARARALENQCYVAVSQTIGTAEWSPAVDLNYGQAGFYATPDVGFPEEGILHLGTPQKPGWLFQELDLTALTTVRTEGQVLNFNDLLFIDQQFKQEPIQVKKHRL